jgi:tRNA pseudouridine32 synthase/23S rRNA pseudouridine746 synthase/23S rRNA pseudouridine1911/1915/1917 synthase
MKTQLLLEALAFHAQGASKTSLKSLIADRRVSVDGKIVSNPKAQIHENQKIVILPKEKKIASNIKIFYEDSHLTVVNKPENLLSVAQDMGGLASLHGYLKAYYKQKIIPVHRLDRGTSGVLVFAKSEQAKEGLKALFMDHDIVREYLGIVLGSIPLDKGRWVDFLEEDERGVVHISSDHEGSQEAITCYEVLDRNETHTLVRFKLETGRKHQIRVQSSHRGFPLVGDDTYGRNKHPRMLLHAQKLEFVHPVTRKLMKFEAPLPRSFKV